MIVKSIETDVKYCRFCGRAMEKNENRRQHEIKCGGDTNKIDHGHLNDRCSKRADLHGTNITFYLEETMRKKIDGFKPMLATSLGEIVRSALVDWLSNPEPFDKNEEQSLVKPRGTSVQISDIMCEWMDEISANRSLLVRKAMERYIKKIEQIR